jgi:hypothetical protein
MRVQLTNAGAALLDANTGPIQVSTFKLGSAYGYVPAPTDTDIHGSLVYTGAPSQYFVVNSNVVKYSVVLDYALGPFNFGEIGLYTSTGVLFALATGDSLLSKIPVTSPGGNAVRADIYLSMVNQNYEMWLDYPDSSNQFRLAVLQSVDQLPPVSNATPNAYIVSGAVLPSNAGEQSAFLAYTDQSGLWSFDAYAFAYQKEATIVAADALSVTISNTDYTPAIAASYYGELICEFSTGANYSICRYVQAVVEGATQTTISFYNQLLNVPIVGDKIIFFSRQSLSTTVPNLPIASATLLGAVKVGTTLTIASDGTLNVGSTSYPVLSVNGKTGDVELTATDITGFATVATTGKYADLVGAPGAYTLPIATTTVLGGIKAPSDGALSIAGDGTIDLGFSPVKTVNGTSPDGTGNVTINIPESAIGLVSPANIPAGDDLNNVATYGVTGIYFCTDANSSSVLNNPATTSGFVMDVEAFSTTGSTGGFLQRLMTSGSLFFRRYNSTTNTWTSWVQTQTAGNFPIATTTSIGVVSVGAGLNITGTGVLSTQIQSVNGHSNANITLTASDVSAVSVTEIDAYGGLPSLDAPNPSTPVPATDPFTFGRMNFWQNTLGTWQNMGYWDANANHVIQTRQPTPPSTPDTNTSLVTGGMQIIDISYDGSVRSGLITTFPDYQTVSGEGFVYQVMTAGTTNIDGTSQWNVGDLIVGVNGKWLRIAQPYTLPVATATVLGGVKKGAGLDVAGDGTLSATGVANNSLTSATSWFRQNPDGTIEMGGTVTLASGTNSVSVTLPTAIPTMYLDGQVTDTGSSCYAYGISPVDATHVTVSAPVYWLDPTGASVLRASATGKWRILCK